jgi:hypothetical protein
MAAFEAVCDGKVRALTTARVAPTQMRLAHHGARRPNPNVARSPRRASPQPKCGLMPYLHIWQVLSVEQFKALDESESLWRPYGERALLAVAHLDHAIPGYWTQKLRDRFYVKRRNQKVEIKVEALCQVRSPLMALDCP